MAYEECLLSHLIKANVHHVHVPTIRFTTCIAAKQYELYKHKRAYSGKESTPGCRFTCTKTPMTHRSSTEELKKILAQ